MGRRSGTQVPVANMEIYVPTGLLVQENQNLNEGSLLIVGYMTSTLVPKVFSLC